MDDDGWNIINEGFLLAEEINKHFSSVFTREDINSLPRTVTTCNGPKTEMLGRLIVMPEGVASKISNMKENKSPGVDGMSSNILKQ